MPNGTTTAVQTSDVRRNRSFFGDEPSSDIFGRQDLLEGEAWLHLHSESLHLHPEFGAWCLKADHPILTLTLTLWGGQVLDVVA